MTTSHELELTKPLTPPGKIAVNDKQSRDAGPLVCNRRVVVSGKIVRVASIHDEPWIEDPLPDEPQSFVDGLRSTAIGADLFTFTETPHFSEPRFPEYH